MQRTSSWDLDFAASRKAAQKDIGPKLEILRPLILLGHTFLRDAKSVCVDEVDHVALIAFRQCLEFADGVDILLRHQAIVPAAALARGALEHAPQVVYLLRKRDHVLAVAYLLSSLRQAEQELERKRTATGLDEEDRRLFDAELSALHALYEEHARDRAGKEALSSLKALKPGRPWFSINNGPENVHRLLHAVELAPLSHFYSDLNPVVHGGMPLLATAPAPGQAGGEPGTDWLCPLRAPAPWDFRPVLATGMAVNVAFVNALAHFAPRLQGWVQRVREFRVEHNRRCERAGMAVLSIPG